MIVPITLVGMALSAICGYALNGIFGLFGVVLGILLSVIIGISCVTISNWFER